MGSILQAMVVTRFLTSKAKNKEKHHRLRVTSHRCFCTSSNDGHPSHPFLSDDEETNKENYYENYYKLVHGFALPHIGAPEMEVNTQQKEDTGDNPQQNDA